MGTTHNDPGGRYSDAWWAAVAADLGEAEAERRLAWGDADAAAIAGYVAGTCTTEERARVERAMDAYPAVRECVAVVRELTAAVPPRPVRRPIARRLLAAAALVAAATIGWLALRSAGWRGANDPPPLADRPGQEWSEQVRIAARRAEALKDAPSDAPEVRALRRDALRLRLEAFPEVTASPPLLSLLERTEPAEPSEAEAELKAQVARIAADLAPRPAAGGPDRQARLLSLLPPGLREGSVNLYGDVQRAARSRGDKLDPALANYLVGVRRPGDQVGMIIPACFPLSDAGGKLEWDRLLAAVRGGVGGAPIQVVIDLGTRQAGPDPDYVRAIEQANRAGVGVLAYVNCDGGDKDLKKAEDEAARWHRYYPGQLRGIFFDNQPEINDVRLNYSVELFRFARGLDRRWQIVSCTVGECDEECLTKTGADVVFRYGRPGEIRLKGWEAKYDPARFGVMVRAVDDPAQADRAIGLAAAMHFGWIYVTGSEGMPDRSFEFLPGYLARQVAEIGRLNAAIRGKLDAAPREGGGPRT